MATIVSSHSCFPISTSDPQRATSNSLWTTEGLAGVCQNELTPQLVHRAAGAFASWLNRYTAGSRSIAVIGGDGRPIAAELVAAASEAVRWAGCDVVELGNASSGMLTMAIRQSRAQGGLLIGNSPSQAHTASIAFFGTAGRPWSLGGSLDVVKSACEKIYARPTRAAGTSVRFSVDAEYRAAAPICGESQLAKRIVFDSACGPLETRLRQMLPVESSLLQAAPLLLSSFSSGKPKAIPPFRQRREKMVARQVIVDAADFGIWIDGNGEACTVIDDRGLPIPPQRLISLLARCPFDETNLDSVVVQDVSREGMFQRLQTNDAAIGGDGQGRVWLRTIDGAPYLDALMVVAHLLRLLDHTGQPLKKLVG